MSIESGPRQRENTTAKDLKTLKESIKNQLVFADEKEGDPTKEITPPKEIKVQLQSQIKREGVRKLLKSTKAGDQLTFFGSFQLKPGEKFSLKTAVIKLDPQVEWIKPEKYNPNSHGVYDKDKHIVMWIREKPLVIKNPRDFFRYSATTKVKAGAKIPIENQFLINGKIVGVGKVPLEEKKKEEK